ncbi:MAG: zinc ribbon domain-containing protein [Bacteroidia bacterium]|nr:zinc ribbon domain-containing protein [Bacteroidia bacterium]
MNCPFCQAPLLPQSNFCNVCGKPQGSVLPVQVDKEKKRYRKFIVFTVVFLMGQTVLYWLLDLIGYLSDYRINAYSSVKPVSYLITICFYSIPLMAAFAFPKKSVLRILFISIGSVCLALKIALYIKDIFVTVNF